MLLRMIQLSQSGCGSNQTKVMTLYLVTERLSSNFVDYLSNKIVSRSHSGDTFPPSFTVPLSLTSTLRYGENPHQKAAFYSDKSLSSKCWWYCNSDSAPWKGEVNTFYIVLLH
jgi:AICAR transformylase/IMP cyclohydrolase PurH